ncbi:hypothetical protein [Basilea psittacipulmonis]|uniref:hypothetical protein n=1 Tax=Basilea psittacipulmonis TaxID=1472345 RepID=UPI0006924038|nr:hypothetical protein [Basilea psittacipulmonis]
MANFKIFQRSFAGGEVTPELFGRIDDVKYVTGLAVCRNFIPKPHGPITNRPGFAFVREVKDSSKKVRLIPFTFSTTQTMVIEFGAEYFRFHTHGATLLKDGQPYEITNPYQEEDLFDVHFVQSADVLTLVHPNYPPKELRRKGATNWELVDIKFNSLLAPPENVRVGTGGGEEKKDERDTSKTYEYFLVKRTSKGVAISDRVSVKTNLDMPGAYNVINITDTNPDGATYDLYRVLKWNRFGARIGIAGPYIESYALVGSATLNSITDNNVQGLKLVEPVIRYDAPSQRQPFGNKHVSYPDLPSPSGNVTKPTFTIKAEGNQKVKNTDYTYSYVVTSVDANQAESKASKPATVQSNLYVTGVKNRISWEKVEGAVRYHVYKLQSGVYGYVGQSDTLSFEDDNIDADLSTTPPLYDDVFNGPGEYPGAVSYFEQRRCFAGTINKPQNIWMTKSATESNMSYSLPVRDDDRIAFRVAAREANTIRHIIPLTHLILLTSSAEWTVTSVNSDAITPKSISVSPQSYVGANNVQPIIATNSIIYVTSRGGHVRELGYNAQAQGIISGDLSLRAPHLFDGLDIKDMAFTQAPQPIVWFVSSNGKLLGLTYVPEQQVGAWHWHDTDGMFESCTAVTEDNEDVLYTVVKRNINGKTVRYIERMSAFLFGNQENAFFVDSGLSYSGVPIKELTGLDHLEGKKLNVLVDGSVHPQCVVKDGKIALNVAGSVIHVGLPIVSDMQTLPIAVQLDNAYGQGRVKNINRAWLRVYQSSGIWVGPDEDNLREYKQRRNEPLGSATKLKTGEVDVLTTPSWTDGGQVFVRQTDPLPLTIISLTAEVTAGG